MTAPLVVTLAVDDTSQERLQALRTAHFPAERDVVPAHVSLFHALPGEQLPVVLEDVRAVCRRAPFGVEVTGVRSLGRGAALVLAAPALLEVRGELAARWQGWLTRQDSQRFSAHVTVQNRVDPAQAKALVERLAASFAPWWLTATGVHLWRYVGGPWTPVATVPFAAPG